MNAAGSGKLLVRAAAMRAAYLRLPNSRAPGASPEARARRARRWALALRLDSGLGKKDDKHHMARAKGTSKKEQTRERNAGARGDPRGRCRPSFLRLNMTNVI